MPLNNPGASTAPLSSPAPASPSMRGFTAPVTLLNVDIALVELRVLSRLRPERRRRKKTCRSQRAGSADLAFAATRQFELLSHAGLGYTSKRRKAESRASWTELRGQAPEGDFTHKSSMIS